MPVYQMFVCLCLPGSIYATSNSHWQWAHNHWTFRRGSILHTVTIHIPHCHVRFSISQWNRQWHLAKNLIRSPINRWSIFLFWFCFLFSLLFHLFILLPPIVFALSFNLFALLSWKWAHSQRLCLRAITEKLFFFALS